ncbi:MAG: hypothetical protein WD151_16380 [Phycisphaeraceae bacterium]
MTTTTPPDHDLLLAYVRDRDVPCPRCRYNLRDIERPYCPECGTQPTLTVGDPQQPLGAWLLLTVVLWIGAAWGFEFIVWVVIDLFTDQGYWQYWLTDGLVHLFFSLIYIACLPLAVAMLLTRRWYCRMPGTVQWSVAGILSGMLMLVIVANFSYWLWPW